MFSGVIRSSLFLCLLLVFLPSIAAAQRMPSFNTKPNKNLYEERYISHLNKQEKEADKERKKHEKEQKKLQEQKRKAEIAALKKQLKDKNNELKREKKLGRDNDKKLNKEIAELRKRLEKIEGKPAKNAQKAKNEDQPVSGDTVEQVRVIGEPTTPQVQGEVPEGAPAAQSHSDNFFNEIMPENENEPVIITSDEEVLGEKKKPSTSFLGKLKRALW